MRKKFMNETKKNISILLVLFLLFNMFFAPAYSAVKTEENNYLKIERKSKDLNSRLAEKYTGYEYTITNIYQEPVEIKSINVINNATGQIAYLSTKRTDSQAAKDMINKGKKYALPTLSLSLIGSVIAVPFAVLNNKIGDKGAQRESERFDIGTQKPETLKPGKKLTFSTMALKKYSPYMRLVFKNPITDEDMTMELR